jgi:hypothetical protein
LVETIGTFDRVTAGPDAFDHATITLGSLSQDALVSLRLGRELVPGSLYLGRERFVSEFIVLVPEPSIDVGKASLAIDSAQGRFSSSAITHCVLRSL